MLHILRLGYYLHSPSAKHEAGTHKHRIANLFGSLNALLNRGNRPSRGLWNIKLLKQSLEGASILCLIYGSTVRSDYLNSSFAERLCKIDCSLSAERSYDALRLLKLNDIHYILNSQGLEIQLVGNSIIRRNRLRIVINNDGFKARCLNCPHGMNRRIVKLDTLTYSYRT